ncbi:MAG TPA: response regulator [Myxococcales bacterium]|jgi:two-component system, cell cycle response regulator DivK|nr:response regulator [Myxococcales bacterium]
MAMLKLRENRRLRVLLVDDYPIARRMFSTGLAGYGVDTCEAGDAAEAIAVATEQSPDVVVVDLFLAGSSGLEVARELRARNGGERVAIIALSGHAGAEYRERAAEAGCDLYLVKPCTTDQLVAAIEAILPSRTAA